MVPIVISSDQVKEKLRGYDPRKAELFHVASSKIADKEFGEKLKKSSTKDVILMCGGSASGKTEFLSRHLSDFDGIVFDSTLPTVEGAKIKIKKILKAKKIPHVYAVFPDNLATAFTAFLHRDRKFGDEHFYRTHSSSRKTLLWIAENYPEIPISLFESRYLKRGGLLFDEYTFENRSQMIEFLKKSQYTESEIIDKASRI